MVSALSTHCLAIALNEPGRPISWMSTIKRTLLAFVILSCAALATNLYAFSLGKEIGSIELKELPKEGRETYALIKTNGPFAYAKDGSIFGNREKILPKQKRGYYREYTVKTPGARNRGARRIVCGEKRDCYYTADHYASFKLIKE